jgi:hypothetical protein
VAFLQDHPGEHESWGEGEGGREGKRARKEACKRLLSKVF